jgi:hypothetical protein
LDSTQVDDSAIPALVALPKLASLDVSNTNISGRGLLALREALPANALGAQWINLSGAPSKKLARPGSLWVQVVARTCALDGEDRVLKLVDFSWSNIQDEHLAALHRLKHVELINLRGSDATPGAIAELRKALPRCEVLYESDGK